MTTQTQEAPKGPGDVTRFYDDLSDVYHLIYRDWEASISKQAADIQRIITQAFGPVTRIHDAAAGIGTQALGLAKLGFNVSASDISPEEIARLRREAIARGVTCPAEVRDMRDLSGVGPVEVAVVLDNALPHLLTDEDILAALRALHSIAARGVVVSVRDYAAVDRTGRRSQLYDPKYVDGELVTFFQIWEFRPESPVYDLKMYLVRDRDGQLTTRRWHTAYYAVTVDRLVELFHQAGFARVDVLREGFFQPVLVGHINA
ncbi:putative class I SAM-dependent methyltransferase [Paratrimastix pyriformis]|uniref:Class I SAM-dependent methyltransferase n=1 Tax=Paratrimastix pyriformis TaxID=342808 RepID=A0ABQ8UGN8_9EUKA|nr:putative class I SAM-dependent methyltransferase [Paratrimastix pyriformis]